MFDGHLLIDNGYVGDGEDKAMDINEEYVTTQLLGGYVMDKSLITFFLFLFLFS
jgi:hypothetical protein